MNAARSDSDILVGLADYIVAFALVVLASALLGGCSSRECPASTKLQPALTNF